LHAGSENVLLYFKNNLYIIKTLKEFQYIDDDGKDQGANVRQKAKDITNLLQDEARLREERRARAHMRDRMVSGRSGDASGGLEDEDENARRRTRTSSRRQENARRNTNRDDEELRKAIEESKRSAEEDELRESRNIAEAIRLSEEEMTRQSKALEDSNAASLFDDQPDEKCVLSDISTTSFHYVLAGRIRPATLYYHQLTTISFPLAFSHSLLKCPCSHSLRRSILINSKPSKRRCRFVLTH
jgi:epsin